MASNPLNGEKPLFPSIAKINIPQQIVDAFKAKIYAREFLPGDQLPSERELIEMFGVGRSSVREALKALTYMGFIEARHGGGYFMKDTTALVSDHWTNYCLYNHIPLEEYIDARYALESELVRLAAQRATSDEIAAMRELGIAFSENLHDHVKLVEIDFQFHLALARSARNRVLLEMLTTTRKLMMDYILGVARTPGRVQVGAREHLEIVDAIEGRNPEGAAAVMHSHLGKNIHKDER